jgi:hypothetical protein
VQIPVGIETPHAGKYTVKLTADQAVTGEDFLAVEFSTVLTALPGGRLVTLTTLGPPGSEQTIDLRRFNSDGTADTRFGKNGVVHILDLVADHPTLNILQTYRDGSMLIGGVYSRYESPNASTNGLSLTQVNASGRNVRAVNILNSVIMAEVGVSDDRWTSVTVTADKKIVAAGFSPLTQRVFFDRYNADLKVDRHFGNRGRVTLTGTTTVPRSIISGPGTSLTVSYPDFSTAIINADGSVIHHIAQDFVAGVAVGGARTISTNDPLFYTPSLTLMQRISTTGQEFTTDLVTGMASNERARVLQVIAHADGSLLLLVERTRSFGTSVDGI